MSKLIYFLAFISIPFVQTQSASEYFMFKTGAKYQYTALGVDGAGKIPEMSYQCISVKNAGATVKGSFYENNQWGSQNQQMYLATGNEVQMIYTKSAYGGGEINPPNPILKVPTANSNLSWTWGETAYSSSLVDSVITKVKTYSNCVVVIEKTKPEYKLGTKKKYYVKGVGLVKIEFYSYDGKLNKFMSFELTKIT